jgi:hypothetical protein
MMPLSENTFGKRYIGLPLTEKLGAISISYCKTVFPVILREAKDLNPWEL